MNNRKSMNNNKMDNFLQETGTDTEIIITHNQQTGKH